MNYNIVRDKWCLRTTTNKRNWIYFELYNEQSHIVTNIDNDRVTVKHLKC